MWLAAELEGDPCPYSFGAGRDILRQAGTLRGTQARFGADAFACCVLGQCCSPNGFGRAFAKRWMPQTIEFSQGFEKNVPECVSEVGALVADPLDFYNDFMT